MESLSIPPQRLEDWDLSAKGQFVKAFGLSLVAGTLREEWKQCNSLYELSLRQARVEICVSNHKGISWNSLQDKAR